MADPIDPALARKLDAFTVPPLPGDFADAVLARAMALPPEPAAPPLPRLRRPSRARWWRGGAAGMGIIAAGMISVAAAASGWLGAPVREAVLKAPLIGAVIERVVPRPEPAGPALVRRAEPETPSPSTEAVPETGASLAATDPLERRAELRRRVAERLTDDPARQAWLEQHPRVAARLLRERARRDPELRANIRQAREEWRAERGLPPLREARQPLVEPSATPGGQGALAGMRAQRLERIQERREQRLEAARQVTAEPAAIAPPQATVAQPAIEQPDPPSEAGSDATATRLAPAEKAEAIRKFRRERRERLRRRAQQP